MSEMTAPWHEIGSRGLRHITYLVIYMPYVNGGFSYKKLVLVMSDMGLCPLERIVLVSLVSLLHMLVMAMNNNNTDRRCADLTMMMIVFHHAIKQGTQPQIQYKLRRHIGWIYGQK